MVRREPEQQQPARPTYRIHNPQREEPVDGRSKLETGSVLAFFHFTFSERHDVEHLHEFDKQ